MEGGYIQQTDLRRHKTSAKDLVKSKKIFSLLVDAVQDYAIFALDRNGVILTWNLGAKRLKGYEASDVIGTHFSRFYTEPDIKRDHPNQELKLAEKTGTYEEEGWRVRKDGTKFWANVVITALKDQNGDLLGFGKVTRDLTERKNAEVALRDSEERMRLMITHVTDYSLITLDQAGLITSWNSGAERLTGYRSDEIVGQHVSCFYPDSDILEGKAEMELRVAADEGRYVEEGWRVRKNKTMFWASVSVTAMRTEDSFDLRGFVKVTKDLTAKRQAEEALRQSQERYRLLVDNVSDYALILLDSNGRVTNWNLGAAKITGFESREILGGHFSKLYRAEDIFASKPRRDLAIVMETGRFEEESLKTRRNGTTYWGNFILTAIRDANGNIKGYSCVIQDLTERNIAEAKLRESEERFRLLVESVDEYAIFMLDSRGNIVTWNKGAERNTGYKSEEIIGEHFAKFYSLEDIRARKPEKELSEAVTTGKFEEEGWRLRKGGARFWSSVVITPIFDSKGDLLGFAKVTKNLTERKIAEDKLRGAFSDLETRIEQRTKDLVGEKNKAELAVKIRDQFFSMASHELKTPLSSLKLQTQFRKRALERGNYSAFSPSRLTDLFDEDARQLERLTFLIDNMLDVSRVTSGTFKLSYEEVRLDEMAGDVLHRLRPLLSEARIHYTARCSESIVARCDRLKMEQVLMNLISNATKYAPSRPLEIDIRKDAHSAIITVRDHGPGIPQEDRERIFEAFKRLKEREADGLGLGLYIVREIIKAHEGKIGIDPNVTDGTAFIIEIPLRIQ
ncbi:MAG: PAS domain S-box protein [Oligoflexales bacterium]